ncbi:MAG: SLC13 family permease [Sediminibacterium sp.]|jgi:gluconate:H+ symporter, GntP family
MLLDPIFILLVGIFIVVGGIIGLKLHPFLALIFAAIVVALLTPISSLQQFGLSKGMDTAAALAFSKKGIGERVATEFGNTCAKIGILIAMAAIIGKCMLESGSAEKIIRSLLKLTGIEKAPIAFLLSSFFLGMPVFFDTVIFLMMPLAKAMTLKIGKNYLFFIMCIMAGAAMANSLVPPAPGPLFLIGEMHIPIGLMMGTGIIVGLFTITAGYLYASWTNKKYSIPLRDAADARIEDLKIISNTENSQLPSLLLALLPVLVPIIFITLDAIFTTILKANPQASIPKTIVLLVKFLGDKNIAIVIGGILALLVIKKYKKENLSSFIQNALMSGGGIILITAAGGAFGGMIQQTGISAEIGLLTANYQMALIPMAFFIAALIRTAQGSATVALITTSGVLAGMATNTHLSFNPVYIGLAIGCGSKIFMWMNDPGFWILSKLSNLTEKEVLKTISPLLVVMGFTGLVVILIAAKLFPLL